MGSVQNRQGQAIVAAAIAVVPASGSEAIAEGLTQSDGRLIGASANMVTAGIAERAGFPITYAYFLKEGAPAVLVTVSLATLWLLLRFYVLG